MKNILFFFALLTAPVAEARRTIPSPEFALSHLRPGYGNGGFASFETKERSIEIKKIYMSDESTIYIER